MEELINLVLTLEGAWIYIGIFAFMFLESIIVVIPSEILMVITGVLAYQRKVNLWLALLASASGSILGAFTLYFVAAGVTDIVTRQILVRFFKKKDIERAERFFLLYGKVSVFFSQFVPGIRSLISFPAGMFRMNPFLFLLYGFMGAFFWNLIWTGSTYLVGSSYDQILSIYRTYEKVVLGVLALLTVVFILFVAHKRFWQRRKSGKS